MSTMRAVVLAAAAWVVGCGAPGAEPPVADGPSALDLGASYLHDAEFRRQELELSLVNPDNGYSKLRLGNYRDDRWGSLPEWIPRVAPIPITARATPADSDVPWREIDVDAVPWEESALVDFGRRAFFEYPTQLATYLQSALRAETPPLHYGLWTDAGAIGGAMWVELPGGVVESGIACAACHATAGANGVVAGRNNPDIDVGALLADYEQGAPSSWGPGRLDVTNDGIDNPTAIADLRPVRSEVALQHAATVRNGLVPLAIRIETLIITSLGQTVRPPRKLVFAIALYLWELESKPLREPDAASRRGQTTFARACAGCHQPPAFSGPSVAIDEVGTDPTVGLSPERTTGLYRVPSLRSVGDRERLFANGAVSDLIELLDEHRTAPGHTYGLSLTAAEKADLIAYLQTL